MTEDEHVRLNDQCNVFWFGLGELVAKMLDQVPEELEGQLLEMLEDRASVHGSPFEKYRAPKWPPRNNSKPATPRTPRPSGSS